MQHSIKRIPSLLPVLMASSSSAITNPLLTGLPDDIAILILARLPRSYLLLLKSVSKAWKNALEHAGFADARRTLGCLEEWLYIETWNSTTEKLSWFCFDPQTAKWLCLPPVPRKRGLSAEVFGRVSAVLNGKLLVMGGKAGPEGPTLRDLFIYCPLTNKWSRGKHMINTRHNPLVSVLSGKVSYITIWFIHWKMTDVGIGVIDGVDSSLSWSKFQCDPETGIMRIRGHLKLLPPPFKGEHLC